jgi:hypothetical protein
MTSLSIHVSSVFHGTLASFLLLTGELATVRGKVVTYGNSYRYSEKESDERSYPGMTFGTRRVGKQKGTAALRATVPFALWLHFQFVASLHEVIGQDPFLTVLAGTLNPDTLNPECRSLTIESSP